MKNEKIKSPIVLILIDIIITFSTLMAQQEQHISKIIEGVPVINNTYMGFINSQPHQYDSIKAMGVNLFWNGISVTEMDFLYTKGIKLIPIGTKDFNNNEKLWIQYYCDAKWSEWQAEGTNDTDDASLERNLEITEILNSQGRTYVRTIDSIFPSADTIVRGPYYIQENKYVVKLFQSDNLPVQYIADFELMLEKNNFYPLTDTTTYDVSEPICKLQITTCKIENTNGNFYISNVYIIKDTLLTRGSFNNLNTFQKFTLLYTLENLPINYKLIGCKKNNENVEWSGESTANIEFRVIWLGSEKYQLSVDKITVYDSRGSHLKSNLDSVEARINEEINVIKNSSSYNSTVVGWHGIDEVMSIDNFEPIRMVAEILRRQHNLHLYLPMMGRWNGTWDNDHTILNPYGTNKLSPWKVLKKRTGNERIYIWQNAYYFSSGSETQITYPYPNWTNSENRVAITALQYINAKEFDNDFGVSILCSAQNNPPTAHTNDPPPSTILYNVNLALMFGAKYFDLYTYFAHNALSCSTGCPGTYTGMVNYNDILQYYEFTNKWYVWRDRIKPRLNGLMGKTIKKLTPMPILIQNRFLEKISFGTPYKFIQQIINTNSCTMLMTDGSGDAFDLGFFTDSLGRDYFMLISRYYNSYCNPTLRVYFNQSYFQPYRNLNIKNFITGENITKISNQYLSVAMDKGDAVFYGVFPVVKYGGDLIVNDTIKTNTELIDDMRIKNNVNLVIDKGKYYTIKDTLTLEGTGFVTGKGYLNISQVGEINITSWSKSAFKGREGNHPKIYWGKFPYSQNVTSYRIYRRKGETNFTLVGTVSPNSPRYFVDNTVTILDRPEPFATFAEYKVTATYQNGGPIVESGYSNTIRYDEVDGIAIDKLSSSNSEVITEYKLFQNYPNPFNPATVISWQSPVSTHQTLKIYDILGNEVATLVDEYREAGVYQVNFDASRLSSGIYLYRITAGEFSDVKKLVVIK